MLEISLHILDVINNSVKAGAGLIGLTVCENKKDNLLSITISDDGCGMDAEFLKTVTDPFKTTRTTRKVGMGLSLFKAAAEATDGSFSIASEKGKGTTVCATFTYNHIDRQPLGDMAETIITVLSGNSNINFLYRHTVDGREFLLNTREVRQILGDVELSSPEIILWLTDYIKEGLAEITQPT